MYSFDVFDTLITRKTAVPEGIFAIMQDELRKDEYASISLAIRDNFYQFRIVAERLARYSYQRNGIEDVTLEQIYDTLALRGELSELQRKQLISLECEIEYRECVPIEKNVIQIKKILSDGERVVLISDMYLPKKQIYRMLAKADPVLAELRLYVSGDCKKRKYTGAIYEFAMKWSHFVGEECVHTGDNEKTDIIAARKAGFEAKLSWFPDLLPIEKKLLDQTPGNVWLNRVIGCGRRARLALGKEMSKKDDVLIGTSVGGILLCSYVHWVIQSALIRGIDSLYFMKSNGYVLKRIADILIQKTKAMIETYYIYEDSSANRKANFQDGRFAFVDMTENSGIRQYLTDLFHNFDKKYPPIFLFGLEQIITTDNFINFVFYPGRIHREYVLKENCGILGDNNNYLAGIEKFTEFFCEDGHAIVQLEDIEQIAKMLAYIMEMQL
ncbi:MAG: hypothetical protein NC489_15100 [Ruminococcus flavefaciens]|nr:hypothetical protein [Roseburia sp.]MCM1231445.1 hypothetical protein [Ruminococcus flavefaciens]